ncbi:hypothetical protein XENORESO_019586 [Xenotaenia resolanae]|uniref:ATP synthase F0 subunit 8 n=1 Tax=Xenotaenia resolanae TaxID=208358 RepID=A0ABV0X7F0_9TELE
MVVPSEKMLYTICDFYAVTVFVVSLPFPSLLSDRRRQLLHKGIQSWQQKQDQQLQLQSTIIIMNSEVNRAKVFKIKVLWFGFLSLDKEVVCGIYSTLYKCRQPLYIV